MAYEADTAFFSHWQDFDLVITSGSLSDDSSSTTHDRRHSITSSSISGERPLSADSSSMAAAFMPSTPVHDERAGSTFWRQSPYMLFGTPEAQDPRQTHCDCSPMVPYDSPLGRPRFDGSFSDDDDLPDMAPSPLALRRTHRIPQDVQRALPSIFIPPHDGMIKPELMTPFSVLSGYEPSSIESDYFSSRPGQPFSTSAVLLSQLDDAYHDDPVFLKSPSPPLILDPGWDPIGEDDAFIVKDSSMPRKAEQDPKTPTKSQTGIKKKQLKRLGSHSIKGNLRGMTDSVFVTTEPSKIRRCTEPGCHAKFKRKEHLRRHIRTHEHTKPYPCALPDEVCSKSFGRIDNRTQHHATHLKVKPRNKPVGRAFLYECIRSQEDDPEKAEKAIAKLELRMQQDELNRPYRDMKYETDD